jgi:hypothetical protein
MGFVMKLITSYNKKVKIEILDFEETIREILKVEEYSSNVYRCCFDHCEIKDHPTACCLQSLSGFGNTIDEAIKKYCTEINGKHLVFNAYLDNRKEISLKNFELIHTKKYGIDYKPDIIEAGK